MTLQAAKVPPSKPKVYEAVLGQGKTNWKPGVISLIDESRLPVGAVIQAKNLMQYQDGVWGSRWGSLPYGEALTGPITAMKQFVVYNSDGTTTQWILVMDNGTLKKSKDGGAWTSITGHTFSATVPTRFIQWNNKILICNGVDKFCYYDIVAGTLNIYSALTTPGAPTPTRSSSLSAGQFTLYYQITAVNAVGETIGSAVASITVNIARDNWYNPNAAQVTSTSYSVTLTWTAVTGAVAYNVYCSDGVSGVAYYLDTAYPPPSGSPTYTDYGEAAINDFIEVPTTDTTGAPVFCWVGLSGNRVWALDATGRSYWGGTGTNALAFSPALGGGWVDIEPGGSERARWVGEFRDGKGDPLTTVLTAEPSGFGSTWHVDLQSDQIGNTTVIVPVVVRALGAFGTLSPYGVIEANQNIYFHSGTGGFYSTGSVPTLFNILSTNEVSILIRPDVKALFLPGLANVCGIEYDRKLWWSVPYGEANNNRIFVYDLEKNNWNPYAVDFGVTAFERYTDNAGITHLLAVPVGGTQLIELNENFLGDNGQPFECHLQTGLIHFSDDHVQWVMAQRVWFEFGRTTGTLNLIFAGTQKSTPLAQLVSKNVAIGASSNVGFSSYPFSAKPFSYGSAAPSAVTQLSVKKRLPYINRLLNNWEAEIISTALAKWTLNQIIVTGNFVPTSDPSSWIVE